MAQQPAANGGAVQPPAAQKVVGPNVQGNKEEYQLVRRLQTALFGGVYEAKGLTTGRDFAIKVLHKSELTKAQETNSIEFCEIPLSEIRFAEVMRGHPNVMEPEEHFEDSYCFYVVFDLCRGGDLLEALKHKRWGFDEAHAQALIKQAAEGIAYLHKRRVAMQDVSLENMLLHVDESSGHYRVKICDPGQAAIFDLDHANAETRVNFRGLVGKSFRPPELHLQKPYYATKVDSWCLGWSTFYLLTAQPLFMSADPAMKDADWALFQQGDWNNLLANKSRALSERAFDFIFRLMSIDPSDRMSVSEALNHDWLQDSRIAPVLAPKDTWPESLLEAKEKTPKAAGQDSSPKASQQPQAPPQQPQAPQALQLPLQQPVPQPRQLQQRVSQGLRSTQQGSLARAASPTLPTASAQSLTLASAPEGIKTAPRTITVGSAVQGSASDLPPTWAGMTQSPSSQSRTAQVYRVQSPERSPRPSALPAQELLRGRMQVRGTAQRLPYVVATNHSPAPLGAVPVSPTHRLAGSAAYRAVSPVQNLDGSVSRQRLPMQQSLRLAPVPAASHGHTQMMGLNSNQESGQAFVTPRMNSRPRSPAPRPELDLGGPSPTKVMAQPPWAYQPAERMGSGEEGPSRPRSPQPTMLAPRAVQATAVNGGSSQVRYMQSPRRVMPSPVYVSRSPSPVPVHGMVVGPPSSIRAASPQQAGSHYFKWNEVMNAQSPRLTQVRGASRGAGQLLGFDPPSPAFDGRAVSPAPAGAQFTWPMVSAAPQPPATILRR